MDVIARWEWMLILLLVLALAVAELIATRRSIRRDRLRARPAVPPSGVP